MIKDSLGIELYLTVARRIGERRECVLCISGYFGLEERTTAGETGGREFGELALMAARVAPRRGGSTCGRAIFTGEIRAIIHGKGARGETSEQERERERETGGLVDVTDENPGGGPWTPGRVPIRIQFTPERELLRFFRSLSRSIYRSTVVRSVRNRHSRRSFAPCCSFAAPFSLSLSLSRFSRARDPTSGIGGGETTSASPRRETMTYARARAKTGIAPSCASYLHSAVALSVFPRERACLAAICQRGPC